MSARPSLREIADLAAGAEGLRNDVAELLVSGFAKHWPNAWPNLQDAVQEVEESLQEGRISRIALDQDGHVMGWVGGIRHYSGHTWELHPLVVHPACQGLGIGAALLGDLEDRVRTAGGKTIWLGTDDEDGMTSISARDLYPNVLENLAAIKNIRGHPFEFYLKQGYSLVGVIPDANGYGKPDILMAKRVGK